MQRTHHRRDPIEAQANIAFAIGDDLARSLLRQIDQT
jgi:hypothetical protein